MAASHGKEVNITLGSTNRENFRCLNICIVKEMGKKHRGGEENQDLGPEGWRAPVKSQISAEATERFQIRARSINLRS